MSIVKPRKYSSEPSRAKIGIEESCTHTVRPSAAIIRYSSSNSDVSALSKAPAALSRSRSSGCITLNQNSGSFVNRSGG